MVQPSVNIGVVGHVDHGKTTLVKALSGVWTDRHSEELKKGISIRLGYADVTFRRCPNCEGVEGYTTEKTCRHCGSQTELIRAVSFVDSPGHETLMATMLSGAAIMDGALLVISADEPCPQPQTKEHLMALDIIGIKNIVIIQNKIDLVDRDAVIKNYHQIQEFVQGTVAEGAPIIPVSAQQGANMDLVIKAIEENIPTPVREVEKPPRMFIARSFDVNKPGTPPQRLQGGVIGGTLSQGVISVGDEIEIRPGLRENNRWTPLFSTVAQIMAGNEVVEKATPGGLLGVSTKLDPFLTKSDALVGQMAGIELPPTLEKFDMEVSLLQRVVGVSKEFVVEPLQVKEPLMLNIGTATTIGVVTAARKDTVSVALKRAVCAEPGARVAISRRVGARWRLIGSGIIQN